MKWIVFNLMLMISMGISAQRITRQAEFNLQMQQNSD